MKIGSALAKFESTSSLTPVAKSLSAAVRDRRGSAGASQSCDSVGRQTRMVGRLQHDVGAAGGAG